MTRSSCALVLLVCGGLVLGACKKKDSDSSDSTAATDTPAPTAAPSASAPSTAAAPPSASAAPTESASVAPAPVPTTAAVPQRPIDECCAALATGRRSGRGRGAKNKAARAAEICPGLAALVRQGRATRQQALTQIKSELLGSDIPGSCM